MNIALSRNLRLANLGTVMAVMLASAPASGQVGSKSKDSQTEASDAVDDPGAVAESQDTKGVSADTDAANAEQAGANSFDTLCGNGQGKPDETAVRKKRKGLFGVADRMASITRKIPLVGDFLVDSANNLSQAVSCRLYPEEQEQAAEATQAATQSGEIGKTVAWQSTVRENVSGSSTISSKNALPDGTPCMVLADIVIVDGEELRVSKTMCKLPGAARYTIMKA